MIHETIIEIEGQRGVLQIILVLHRNGETISGKLYNNTRLLQISNNITAQRAIQILLKHDLIHQKCKKGSRAIYYCLTEKGKRLAKCLNEMQEILNEPLQQSS